jgi:hypothetical protein
MNDAAISIEPEDLELSPFNHGGGLGKAHPMFGEQLPKLLDDLQRIIQYNERAIHAESSGC